MAEHDDAQKTEEPTQKKLEDAHKKGQVAKSREVSNWFMLAGIALVVALFAGQSAHRLTSYLAGVVGHLHAIPAEDPALVLSLMRQALWEILLVLSLPFLLLIVAAILGNMVQHKPVLSVEKITPKLEKISPLSGAKRLFSMQAIAEFLKSIAKLLIVGGVTIALVWPERGRLEDVVTYGTQDLLSLVFTLGLRMLMGIVAIMGLIAGADFLFQRFQFMKQQRMSKQEIKDEHKQLEGDPMVKARLRQVRQERSRQRMMAAVPEATVVITNPTHFAVALKYEPAEHDAPVLVAKGVDAVAFRIRDVATEHDIPIVENPPLARALHASVDLDEAIPPEHYKAVAEVIGFVMKMSKRSGGAGARPGRT